MALSRDIGYRMYFWVTFSILLVSLASAFLLTGNIVSFDGSYLNEDIAKEGLDNVKEDVVIKEEFISYFFIIALFFSKF